MIDNDQVELMVEQFNEERDNIDEEISLLDSARKHIIFSFAVIPMKLNPDGFNFNDADTITIIKNLRSDVMYRNPYGGMYPFDDFIKEFTFQGDWYQADYLSNSDMIFNFSRVKIHKSGLIFITIAMDAFPVEVLRGKFFLFRRDEKFLNSLSINTNILAYLIMMWLKLTRTIFSKLEYHGIVKLILNIYSGGDLSLAGDKQILLGNSINPKSNIDVKISELKDNDELLKIIQLILKELLRYFNIDIDKFQEGYSHFAEIIERYFNPVFGDNPK